MSACPFCERIAAGDCERIENVGAMVVAFPPLNPVTEGHALIVPKRCVPDAAASPVTTGQVFRATAIYAMRQKTHGITDPFNLITSRGREATQSVGHFHVHYIPRREGDGLRLPWSPP